jgi:hypothetical protein
MHNVHLRRRQLVAVAALLCLLPVAATAVDEGMWTYDNPPSRHLQERYSFTPTAEWLEHIRLASVRINDGGSGSFVSPRGLVMTNHHVALGQVQKLSREGADYAADGFYAPTLADELKCPDLEVNVLVSMEDVTARVRAATKAGISEKDALQARQAEMARVEKESLDKTGLRSNVVDLYYGGEYWLYRYKRYTDVRLVFAPESQAAFFGGDSDNFTYPRYCLDVAFLRVYENGQPAATPHYLKLDPKGPGRDELVFVSGNPGSTDRLFTYAQLEFQRDTRYPIAMDLFDTWAGLLRGYAKQGAEAQRRAQGMLLAITNSQKAYQGEYGGLLDEAVMARLEKAEDEMRAKVASRLEWQQKFGDAWDVVARMTAEQAGTYKQRTYRTLRGSSLADRALTIVRYVTEVEKPDADRLPGFHDSELEPLKFRLFSPAPVYPDMEEAVLGGFLEKSRRELGDQDYFVSAVLNDRKASDVAAELIKGTRLAEVDFRKSLVEGGKKAVEASKDPLIVLLRKLDPQLREDEKSYRDDIESVLAQAREKIAQARFAVYGKTVYPDATFTPRLAYGTVKGYPMNGTQAPHLTTLYGLYDRSISFGREGEYALPERFWKRQEKLDLSTPVNFVSTSDIIGGNSGSPVINRKGDVVGLIFDGNIESLVGRFAYEDARARALAVHPAYIIEALGKLYDAGSLASELVAQN